MNRGILYTVFGRQYENLAFHTIRHSRQFTYLPIHILTNVIERNKAWNNMPNVSFTEIDIRQKKNRSIKTQMDKYTPFDETLYLDCDSVIQRTGIEDVFEMLEQHDMVLNLNIYWPKNHKIVKLYKTAMKITNTTLPLSVYNGAFICFKKNENIRTFFLRWYKYWRLTGEGREMPALACAINKSSLSIKELTPYVHMLFEPSIYNPECIVQHNYNSNQGHDFFKEFALPEISQYKPFDKKGSESDWTWVDFDE